MMKRNQKNFCVTICLFISFVSWTIAISYFDVQAVGPRESSVGFATLNTYFHNLTGVHMLIYKVTDWLGVVPFCFVLGFAVLGLVQFIKRRSLLKVDYDILVLGGFYILVIAVYVFFEVFAVNFRPILIEGILEASYPSSTTLLVMSVMTTALMQFNCRIKNKILRKSIVCIILVFTIFMVIGRLISGVHWFTDIVGGVLLSAGLIMLYYSFSRLLINKEKDLLKEDVSAINTDLRE